ncbi:MAG TPA: exo-alpha-sialidase [Verrucomicrobiales bacterium]|nr:exo-alpha-sialidase [Verrucomicrobiales bacterium]
MIPAFLRVRPPGPLRARRLFPPSLLALLLPGFAFAAPQHRVAPIFPPESWHNHGSCIVETPDGDLLACWFHGSGERTADDVKILGARLRAGSETWSEPFLMADTPGLPDTNCCMIVDREHRLWLLWPTIQDNRWESALMKYRISSGYSADGPPHWEIERVLHVKPGDRFPALVREKTAAYLSHRRLLPEAIEWAAANFRQADDKLTRRIGWFTRAHPLISEEGRMLVGLYSDGFSFSLTAWTDDGGDSWSFSEPMVGGGNIQPSFARRDDGTLVAFMRDNGPPPKRVHVSESRDLGETWSPVEDHPQLANPGSGLELIRLRDGRFLAVYNDTEEGRHSLAVSLSQDGGRTFPVTRHLEKSEPGRGQFHYPSVIEARDGALHVSYSTFLPSSAGQTLKTITHAAFNLEWVEAGPSGP